MSGQAGRYQRSAGGLIGALLILLGVIAAFLVMRELVRTTPEIPVREVDYQETVEHARGEASFDLLAPETLPTGWRATSATFTPAPAERWHLGVLTDDMEYVGLEQRGTSVRSMVEEYVNEEAVEGRPIDIDGPGGSATWASYTDDKGDVALVRRDGEMTTLVVGTVDRDVLVDYVESLR